MGRSVPGGAYDGEVLGVCDVVPDRDGVTVGVPVGDAPSENVDVVEGVIDGVGAGDGEFDAEGVGVELGMAVPRIAMLSAERAPAAAPTATAMTRQQTVGLLSAAAGIAAERTAGTHVPAGASDCVTPKFVKGPAVPAVL